MSYNSSKHGRADYGKYIQVPDAFAPAEGSDTPAISAQKFAELVHIVNPTEIAGCGTVIYSKVIQSRSTDVYIAAAPVGSTLAAAAWQVQKIDTNGSITWADSGLYTQVASGELSGLIFNV